MATITNEYLGALRTRAIHERSQTELITDAPVDNNGKGESFSPTDLVATSLITCMITVMGIEAQKKNIPFEGVKGDIRKLMRNDPRRIARLETTIEILDQGQSSEEKDLLRKIAEDCPVALSLHPEIDQRLELRFV